jgi:hypothetical protein
MQKLPIDFASIVIYLRLGLIVASVELPPLFVISAYSAKEISQIPHLIIGVTDVMQREKHIPQSAIL